MKRNRLVDTNNDTTGDTRSNAGSMPIEDLSERNVELELKSQRKKSLSIAHVTAV